MVMVRSAMVARTALVALAMLAAASADEVVVGADGSVASAAAVDLDWCERLCMKITEPNPKTGKKLLKHCLYKLGLRKKDIGKSPAKMKHNELCAAVEKGTNHEFLRSRLSGARLQKAMLVRMERHNPTEGKKGVKSCLPKGTKPKIRIFGERNTGTKVMASILADNYDVKLLDRDEMGWKHMIAANGQQLSDSFKFYDDQMGLQKEETVFVITVKNPFAWLVSFHNQPFEYSVAGVNDGVSPSEYRETFFSQFIRTPGYLTKKENAEVAFDHPLEMWNLKYTSYLNLLLDSPNVFFSSYESLLADPEALVNRFGAQFCLERKQAEFRNSFADGEYMQSIWNNNKDYYERQLWVRHFGDHAEGGPEPDVAADCAFINEALDDKVLAHFGYEAQDCEALVKTKQTLADEDDYIADESVPWQERALQGDIKALEKTVGQHGL